MRKFLSETWGEANSHTLATYEKFGGYKALRRAVTMTSEEIIEEVKRSELRGRGGAGFRVGVKWGFLPKDTNQPKYLVINADESEPGTFKDRQILWRDPHRLIEGALIACYALGIKTVYNYIRGEFMWIDEHMQAAIDEAYKAGYLGKNILGKPGFDVDFYNHYGAGAYICGEETGLLESLEGKPGQPRNKPPFPAIVGAFGCPTIINNVESIACVPSIIQHGPDAFLEAGIPGCGGTKLFSVAGHVNNPGVFEANHSITLRQVIYDYGGGVHKGRGLKAVIPGGSSCPVLLPDQIDIGMDFDSMRNAGTMFGTGGVVVVDDHTSIVRLAARTAHFFHHESCGQCTPCREGTGWVERIINDIADGRGTMKDVELLVDVCNNVEGNTICALGDAMAMPIRSLVTKFRHEFEEAVATGGVPAHVAW
jgi:NADH-quinone oxidoreductase subunit F